LLDIGCSATALVAPPLHWLLRHCIGCSATALADLPLHWFIGHCIGFALVAPPLTNLSATDFSATGFLTLPLSQAVLLLQIVSP
jgi:hypothetical protein